MSIVFLAVLAIVAPDSSEAHTAKTPVNWNQTVLSALKEHAQTRLREPAQSAAKLANVARQVAADGQLSEPARRKLLGQIHRRLMVSGQTILAQQLAPPGAGRDRTTESANAFKEMIEQTIEPESWDVNGGAGHIHVFRQ